MADQRMIFQGNDIPVSGTQVITNSERELLATNSGKAIFLYDTSNGKPLGMFLSGMPAALYQKVEQRIAYFSMSPEDPVLKLMYENMGGHKSDVTSLAMTSDGMWLFSGGDDCTIRRWNIEDPLNVWSKGVGVMEGHTSAVTKIVYVPSSDFIVSCGQDGTLRIWNFMTAKEVNCVNLNETLISLAISPNGQKLAVGSASGNITIFALH